MGQYSVSLAIVAALLLSACGSEDPGPDQAAVARTPEVRTLALQPQTWQHTINIYGLVEAAARHDDALAALALAERELADSRVLSPVDGVVDRREVEPGETVMPGHVLGMLQAVDVVRITTYVSERDVNYLASGTAAEVTATGARGRRFNAVIESVGVKADPRTGNFPVKLTLPNSEGLLRPGMTARVRLQALTERDVLLIADTALVDRNRERVVFLARDGLAQVVRPVLRATTGDLLPVLGGLVPGDLLIVSGLEHLEDGSPIRIVNGPAP